MGPMADLFPADLPAGVSLLKGAVSPADQRRLLAAVKRVAAKAPLAQTRVKMGGLTSAAMTNCGQTGWWSDEKGYRYTPTCPGTGAPWPAMPRTFTACLGNALTGTKAEGFAPDACLINHYGPGAKMGLHQDKNEKDFSQPIVTVSLGDAADFLIGGAKRSDRPQAVVVESGDVLIMGGDGRLLYHGIRKIYPGTGPLKAMSGRFSLTFRKAL